MSRFKFLASLRGRSGQITNNKLQSGAWCLFVFCCLIFVISPKLASAKTLQFETKTWEIAPNFSDYTTTPSARTDFDLVSLAKKNILGTSTNSPVRLLGPDTVVELQKISSEINQEPKDARLTIDNDKATEFEPGQNGQALDIFQTAQLLVASENNLTLPVFVSHPKKTLSETNNLGIKELVGIGESNFKGSPRNRIFNINVGANKFNGLIIAKDEEFSFNKYLGEVDGEHGFLPELVIKPQGVTPEFGGGLCQVSSTTFRAAMDAGLPITARRNHSFAVQYYAPQGTDATIYPGASDLKFINNLQSPILIRTKIDGTKLFFEFYGTKDDRVVTFDGPVQYDKKPDGSMKATWTRHVTFRGQTTDQVFKSNYLSPALFHHDTVPPPPPPQPTAEVPPTNETITQ